MWTVWHAPRTPCAASVMSSLVLYFCSHCWMELFTPLLLQELHEHNAPGFAHLLLHSGAVEHLIELLCLARQAGCRYPSPFLLFVFFPPGSDLLWGLWILFCSRRSLESGLSFLSSTAGQVSNSEVRVKIPTCPKI